MIVIELLQVSPLNSNLLRLLFLLTGNCHKPGSLLGRSDPAAAVAMDSNWSHYGGCERQRRIHWDLHVDLTFGRSSLTSVRLGRPPLTCAHSPAFAFFKPAPLCPLCFLWKESPTCCSRKRQKNGQWTISPLFSIDGRSRHHLNHLLRAPQTRRVIQHDNQDDHGHFEDNQGAKQSSALHCTHVRAMYFCLRTHLDVNILKTWCPRVIWRHPTPFYLSLSSSFPLSPLYPSLSSIISKFVHLLKNPWLQLHQYLTISDSCQSMANC